MINILIKILLGIFVFPAIMKAPPKNHTDNNSASAAAAAAISTGFSSNVEISPAAASSSSSNSAHSVIPEFNGKNNNKKLLNLFSNSGASPIICSIFDFALGSISKYDSTFIELRKTEDLFIERQLAGYLESKKLKFANAVERTIDQMLECNSFDDFDMLEDDLDIWKRLPLLRNILINIANDVHYSRSSNDIFDAMRSQGLTISIFCKDKDDILYEKTDKKIKGIIYYSIVILRALIMGANNYNQGDPDINHAQQEILKIDFNMNEQNKKIYNQMLKEKMMRLVAEGDNVYEFLANSYDMIFLVIFQIILFNGNFDKMFNEEFVISPNYLYCCSSLKRLICWIETNRKSSIQFYSRVAIDEILNHISINLVEGNSDFERRIFGKFANRFTQKELLQYVEQLLKLNEVQSISFIKFLLPFIQFNRENIESIIDFEIETSKILFIIERLFMINDPRLDFIDYFSEINEDRYKEKYRIIYSAIKTLCIKDLKKSFCIYNKAICIKKSR